MGYKPWLALTILIFFDQLAKFIFTNKHFFIINYTQNTGMAFGLFQGYNWLLILIYLMIIVYLLYLKNTSLPLILILSGAFGNLIDRIVFGFVRDFIDFGIWPVFNLADAFITVGVLLLVIKDLTK